MVTGQQDITFFAETNYRDQCRLFGIKRDDRRRHMYIIGKTGMGKSEMLKQMVYSDIMAGHGLAVIDPHGELAESLLPLIPSNRVNDVVYFNPADLHFPIAFNILESVNPEVRHLIASGLVGVFKKIWADSWGPRLEYVLRNAILALLDYPGSTLLGVLRILTDKTYRKRVIEKIQDPVVRSFWVDEYSKYPDRFQAEAIAPIQNKVGQFLSNALIRNVVGQIKSSIDIRDIMDNQKILILNLSKGRIGEDTSALLGNMMITQIQLAAMGRIDTPEDERKDFYLYVDEFQNFATESFGNILSEARKYRLNLIIANQYIEQLDEKVQAAVFGNVGTIVCFRIGAADAEILVKEFVPYFTEEDLVNLAKWQIFLKLMIDGVASTPFSANTLRPVSIDYGNTDKVIRVSRERYAKDRAVIEDKISRWASSLEEEGIAQHKLASAAPPKFEQSRKLPVQPARVSAPAKQISLAPAVGPSQTAVPRKSTVTTGSGKAEAALPYDAVCASCGKPTKLSFKPDGKRPVYCKDCLSRIRRERALKDKPQDSGRKEEVVEKKTLEKTVIDAPLMIEGVSDDNISALQKTEENNTGGIAVNPGETISLS
ncbi:MAG: CxxC-x17-CxxC domain-containing protein [Patescibacteria group bacterium]|jgi:CxxC-x17-CxxC domain-containing protein